MARVLRRKAVGSGGTFLRPGPRYQQGIQPHHPQLRQKDAFYPFIVALIKRGIAVFNVPAAYTSLIGFFKYSENYGQNAQQAAALLIARRALGFKEKEPKGLIKNLIGSSTGE
ncbi:hypothetical protein [Hydrogenibacillus schlegelii]|uniref:hypothetical protein n=1 Tax=Hydrogenibacillus schlegelii TaxID=1484 RepID=UPI0034A009AE